MANIDLYDPKWIDLVFQDKNKEYGAYQLRKGTGNRNMKALAILIAAALIIGGYLVWKIQADKAAVGTLQTPGASQEGAQGRAESGEAKAGHPQEGNPASA